MSAPRWLMTARLPQERLVVEAMAGDDDAVDALARAWLPHVYRWCARLGGPGFDSEDAAHEVLIVMCRNLPKLREPRKFPGWLFGISRKVIAGHRRRAWWQRWMPGPLVEGLLEQRPTPEAGPGRSLEAKRAADRVWTALDTLSAAHREVLVLCELEERSASEAARLLEIPTGTVKSRLRAARKAFRARLGDEALEIVEREAL